MLKCEFHVECSGCSEWQIDYSAQLQGKSKTFREILETLQQSPEHEIVSVAPLGLRDRLDFQIENGKMGLFKKDFSKKEILDLPFCLQLSPALQQAFTEFRQFQFPIHKGSFRLRVSPEGQRGLWLDFANLDVKKLFDEKNLLLKLLDWAYVEVGQHRKKLVLENSNLKLKDPELRPWTRTWNQGKPIALYSCVSHFSQVGDQANKKLVEIIADYADAGQAQAICEFGSGHGNLTLAIARPHRKILATDIEPLPLAGLKQAAEENGFTSQIQIWAGDFQEKLKIDFKHYDTVLVNPPRSGLKNFLQPLENLGMKPKNFIYMSCYPESFQQDAQKLLSFKYKLKKSHLVDQFPQTKHYEILSWWQLD